MNDADCWHKDKIAVSDYNNRMQLTQYCSGKLPDLNTGSSKIQNYTVAFMKECIDAGADGFRFDSAKHIETPKDDASYASDFWPNVINAATDYAKESRNIDLYCYGEILNNPRTDITGYTDIFVSALAIILSLVVMIDLLSDHLKKPDDKKTEWFYDNKDLDRKVDERDDKNHYRLS